MVSILVAYVVGLSIRKSWFCYWLCGGGNNWDNGIGLMFSRQMTLRREELICAHFMQFERESAPRLDPFFG